MSKCIVMTTVFTLMVSIGSFIPTISTSQEALGYGIADAPGLAGANNSQVLGFFIKNVGQVDGAVAYYSMGNPAVGFRDDGIMFVLRELEAVTQDTVAQRMDAMTSNHIVRSHAYMVRFENSNRAAPEPMDRLGFNANFFIGSDPRAWRSDVPVYGGIVYREIYGGIDLVYRQGDGGVKYEFQVRPGGDPRSIITRIDGAGSVRLDGSGLEVATSAGTIRDSRPYSYLDDGGEVRCDFTAKGVDTFGFDCGRYDAMRTLTIDPLIYSTFLGGSRLDRGYSIKVDSLGNTYLTGQTFSVDFPATPGSYDTVKGGSDDVFVTKLDSTGSSLIYSTFIGGSLSDIGTSIALDSNRDIYVAGNTTSSNFPTTLGVFDTSQNGNSDVFIAKLSQAGDSLLYSTFIGGAENETWPTVEVDSSGNVFVAGGTESPDYPVTPGAYGTSFNGGPDDAFLTKLDSSGAVLTYSTFIGGDSNDFAYSVDLDSDANAFVTGGTFSSDFALGAPGYDKTNNGDADAFIVKVNQAGTDLVYATYVGGAGPDHGLSIAVDVNGNAHVTGSTDSSDFPTTPNAHDKTKNSVLGYNDAFMCELNPSGTSLVYSTYVGGSKRDYGNAIALDDVGNAYVVGWTDSSDLPATPGAFDETYNGNADVFILEFNTLGALANLTYLGGSQTEGDLPFLAIDSSGFVYVTGITNSTDYPTTPGAFDTTLNPVRDAFVTKLGSMRADLSVDSADITSTPQGPVAPGVSVIIQATVRNVGNLDALNVIVRFHDGLPNGSNQIGAVTILPFVAANGGTGTASVTWTALPSGDHDICVVADPDDLIVEISENNNMACKSIVVGEFFHLQLRAGHHLVSFPLKPLNDSIVSLLPAISMCYSYVRLYDASDAADPWKSYMEERPFNDLTRLDHTMGFWIEMDFSCELVVVGVLQRTTSISLRQGWNMVGFPSNSSTYTVADLKAGIGLPGVRVEVEDSNAAPYYLKQVDDSYEMAAGEGYWIYVPSDATWLVHA